MDKKGKTKQTYDAFYSYPDQFRQLTTVDPRLQGFSVADWFRSVGTGNGQYPNGAKGLTDCLVLLYGKAAYRSLVNHFNDGTGYATREDFDQNKDKRVPIQNELHKRFEDWVLSPPGTTYPP